MGFTIGLIGGATLVLGTTYVSLHAHRRNRLHQAQALRAQTYVLNSLAYISASAPPPKTVAEELALLEHHQELLALAEQNRRRRRAAEQRSFLELAKDRWNSEVEGAVRWAATRDWTAAREEVEEVAVRLWAQATRAEERRPHERDREPKRNVALDASAAASLGQGRFAASQGVASLKEDAVRTKEILLAKAEDAGEAGGSNWERGNRKSKKNATKLQVAAGAAGAAEDVAKQEVQVVKEKLGESEAEKVIRLRYEKKSMEEVLSKSVEEVLAERYKPCG